MLATRPGTPECSTAGLHLPSTQMASTLPEFLQEGEGLTRVSGGVQSQEREGLASYVLGPTQGFLLMPV